MRESRECEFNTYNNVCFLFIGTKRGSNQITTKKRAPGVTGPGSAVGNVSGSRCESDCRSRGREFDPGPVSNFCGD